MRVLIVDDSSATRAYVRAVLEADDATVEAVEADSGFEALRMLPRERFELLVVDINMPNINGLELIAFIRQSETHHDTPLLVISTEASERDRARALALGASAYLAKPFAPDVLTALVRTLRAAGGSQREQGG